jgi:glycogen synthase
VRILLLAQFFPPDVGGEERHVYNLANALSTRGHDVVVATQCIPGVADTELLPSGTRVHRFATAAMRVPGLYSTGRLHHPPVPDPAGVRALATIVRRERPDVVHAHNWIVNSALALRRLPLRLPEFGLMLTLHDFSQVCATKRFMRSGSPCAGPSPSRCLPCAWGHYGSLVGPATVVATAAMRPWKSHDIDHVVSVSHAVAHGNRVKLGPRASVIPNFVADSVAVPEGDGDHDSWQPDHSAPEDEFLFFAGELSSEKGVNTLLSAYTALGPERPRLVLAGRRMPETPAELPEGAELHFDWPHDRVLDAFRRCLAAVLPSACPDACPTTVIEAMASGAPVISSSIGGITDLIVDGESGLLVDPANPRQLANAITTLARDPALRRRLACAAFERSGSFTASAVVERLEQIYAQIAPPARRRPVGV